MFRLARLLLAVCVLVAVVGTLFTFNTNGIVRAQDDKCPTIVEEALDKTSAQCARTGRNKTCYGNISATIDPKPGVTDLKFEKPGDTIDLGDVKAMTLGAYDAAAGTWGVALIKVQANLPGEDPNQTVTMIVFGDVQLTDARGTAGVPDMMAPMQAFYIKSSGKSPCEAAPKDGILIQTPQGRQKVELWVNGSTIKLGSTAFIETLVDGELSINTLEGTAEVTAGGFTRLGLPGERIWVPMSDKLLPTGPAREVQPYNPAAVNPKLPLNLLPRAINIVTPRPNVPESGRREDTQDGKGVIVDGLLNAISLGRRNFIIVAGVAFVIENESQLKDFVLNEPVRAVGEFERDGLMLKSLTKLSPAPGDESSAPKPTPSNSGNNGGENENENANDNANDLSSGNDNDNDDNDNDDGGLNSHDNGNDNSDDD